MNCTYCGAADTEVCREAFDPEMPSRERPDYLHCYKCNTDQPLEGAITNEPW